MDKRRDIRMQTLVAPKDIQVSSPLNVNENDTAFFASIAQQVLPEVKRFELRNYRLLADGTLFRNLTPLKESFILTREGSILKHNWKGLLAINLRWPKVTLAPDKQYLLVHNAYTGFYHWLAETLPRICLLGSPTGLTLLLPESYKGSSFLDALEALGVQEVEWLKDGICYQVPDLLFVSIAAQMGSFNPALMRSLADRLSTYFNNKLPTYGSTTPRRIYISREKAPRRKVLNEQAVLDVLEPYGFVSVVMEDLSFAEQVILSSNAEAIVGIHGAGLTNIMFMQAKTQVLEFRMADNWTNYFYYGLAAAMNLKYYYQFCDTPSTSRSVQDADIVVDLNALRRTLDLMDL